MDQEFYSIKETARVFGVHENTIRRAIQRGFLVAIRIGTGKKSPYRISKKCIDEIHIALLKEISTKNKMC